MRIDFWRGPLRRPRRVLLLVILGLCALPAVATASPSANFAMPDQLWGVEVNRGSAPRITLRLARTVQANGMNLMLVTQRLPARQRRELAALADQSNMLFVDASRATTRTGQGNGCLAGCVVRTNDPRAAVKLSKQPGVAMVVVRLRETSQLRFMRGVKTDSHIVAIVPLNKSARTGATPWENAVHFANGGKSLELVVTLPKRGWKWTLAGYLGTLADQVVDTPGPDLLPGDPGSGATAPPPPSPTPPPTAVADSAATVADSAATVADSAATVADSAATVADSAATVADSAATVADSAATVADSAATVADSAATVADSAATVADSAATVADSAATVADSAATVADSAATVADSAATASIASSSVTAAGGLGPGDLARWLGRQRMHDGGTVQVLRSGVRRRAARPGDCRREWHLCQAVDNR